MSFHDSLDESKGRWLLERPRVLELCADWTTALSEAGVEPGQISIEVNPETEPAPEALWNWWISFSLNDCEIESLVSWDLTSVLFEDGQGRFEDEIQMDAVPFYLLTRIGC